MDSTNYGLKEEIREYWGKRSITFDESIGHKVRTESELAAWRGVFGELLGDLKGKRVLELASGTGEITRAFATMGAQVTGIDFAEPMVARARAKHADDRDRVRIVHGDAEATHEPDGTYDAVACRHLVWTLTDPAAAFRDWFRVLKPGGRVAIIDGDWINLPWQGRLQRKLAQLVEQFGGKPDNHGNDPAHKSIVERLPFSTGASPDKMIPMLESAGFRSPRFAPLGAVTRAQRSGAHNLGEWLRVHGYNRFALGMQKPE